MEIYKRGQGTWARGFAIVVFILFIGWGAFEVYRIPAEMNVIVKPGDVIWRDTAERLLKSDIKTTKVRGLANQPVSEALIAANVRPARRIENQAGHGLVLESEEFDKEKIQAIEDAGIRFVPVFQDGKLSLEIEVSDWIRGRTLAEDVTYRDTLTLAGTDKGKVIDEDLAAAIRKELEPFPGTRVGPVFPNAEALEKNEDGRYLLPGEIAVGEVCGSVFNVQVTRVAVEKTNVIEGANFDLIRNLKNRNFVTKVRVEDEGTVQIDSGNLDEIGSRYLVAGKSETVETWWSKEIFLLPLLKVRVTPGLIICVVLFVGLTLVAFWSWNFKRWNDLLIDTQTEMKKVSWPKRVELIGSSTVVIASVLVLGIFLYLVDFLLTTLAHETGLLR